MRDAAVPKANNVVSFRGVSGNHTCPVCGESVRANGMSHKATLVSPKDSPYQILCVLCERAAMFGPEKKRRRISEAVGKQSGCPGMQDENDTCPCRKDFSDIEHWRRHLGTGTDAQTVSYMDGYCAFRHRDTALFATLSVSDPEFGEISEWFYGESPAGMAGILKFAAIPMAIDSWMALTGWEFPPTTIPCDPNDLISDIDENTLPDELADDLRALSASIAMAEEALSRNGEEQVEWVLRAASTITRRFSGQAGCRMTLTIHADPAVAGAVVERRDAGNGAILIGGHIMTERRWNEICADASHGDETSYRMFLSILSSGNPE